MRTRELRAVFDAALSAVDPYAAVVRALTLERNVLTAGGQACDLDAFDRVVVVGAGKAAAAMAAAAETVLGDRITRGVVIVKHGTRGTLGKTEQVEAGHPIPDDAGLRGTQRILKLVRGADEQTLVICLLSGGGSALLVAPLAGITLDDKQRTTDLLLRAGATIDELNAVRKHLSAVKGGRLAQLAYPATVVTLILSDVIGNRLDVIASGPTTTDSSTFGEATAVIRKYGLDRAVPPSVAAFLARGEAGEEAETAKGGDLRMLRTTNVIVASNIHALAAAMERATALGWQPEMITAALQGEARDAARMLAQRALRVRDRLASPERRCLLSGGETTVTVRGNGTGGRNQELALAFALAIGDRDGVTLLSAGTDGIDGPTDAAGAMVDGSVVRRARELHLEPETFLRDNDAYSFFQQLDARTGETHHIVTGPTGTNVMDVQVVLIEAP